MRAITYSTGSLPSLNLAGFDEVVGWFFGAVRPRVEKFGERHKSRAVCRAFLLQNSNPVVVS